jgi:hypothetical protein
VTLHIIPGDTNLPFEQESQIFAGPGFPVHAQQLRSQWFGTTSERGNADHVALLAAKAKAFRYCLVINHVVGHAYGGMAELGGDDFVVCLGGFLQPETEAVIFMHELGHTLGLHHGGGDEVNGKPNYPSIMNYVLAYRDTWNQAFWRLDYSRFALPTLNEAALNEQQPVGQIYYANYVMPYHGIVTPNSPCFSFADWGQPRVAYLSLDPISTTDFNLDCDTLDTSVSADLTYLTGSQLPGALQPSPGETLVGWDDWAHVVLRVSDAGGGFAGPSPPDELSDSQHQWIRDHFPIPPVHCRPDFNNDGTLAVADIFAFLNAWFAGDPRTDFDGINGLQVADIFAFLNAWFAGCP